MSSALWRLVSDSVPLLLPRRLNVLNVIFLSVSSKMMFASAKCIFSRLLETSALQMAPWCIWEEVAKFLFVHELVFQFLETCQLPLSPHSPSSGFTSLSEHTSAMLFSLHRALGRISSCSECLTPPGPSTSCILINSAYVILRKQMATFWNLKQLGFGLMLFLFYFIFLPDLLHLLFSFLLYKSCALMTPKKPMMAMWPYTRSLLRKLSVLVPDWGHSHVRSTVWWKDHGLRSGDAGLCSWLLVRWTLASQ